ncbi:hypothetical protein [Deinococcus koreensis]|uniref:Uncharacterized protein n=1 Tax=Deinococcus koreensis TaxID=2054903 RepID=A0A2K3UZU8_9DEIO|nr:hypothetical protein [Deinococcus koreensis]PNY82053.1 hypothetical protein CVO96_12360 [Deinococcus koreensis]
MQTIENQTFSNQRIELDDTQFVGCTFDGCVLIYSGTGGTSLSDCTIHNTGFGFEGGAAKTLELLSAMYRGGFEELVNATIEGIRTGKPPASTAQA